MEIDIYQGISKVKGNVIKNVMRHKESALYNEKIVFLTV